MKLEAVITLADAKTRLPLLAMERSLRATGCTVPLLVIPYGHGTFALPQNASWLEAETLFRWLDERVTSLRTRYGSRKLLCLTRANYQFVDSDVVFLRDPSTVLRDCDGFVASCNTSWWAGADAATPASEKLLKKENKLWWRNTFNSGQFACDRALFSVPELIRICEEPDFPGDCIDSRFHEQMTLNLLVHLSRVPVINLTHPPHRMDSTWAGDYAGEPNYCEFWQRSANPPYLIHWAGRGAGGCATLDQPLNRLFESFLSPAELAEWRAAVARALAPRRTWRGKVAYVWRFKFRSAVRAFFREWCARGINDVA